MNDDYDNARDDKAALAKHTPAAPDPELSSRKPNSAP